MMRIGKYLLDDMGNGNFRLLVKSNDSNVSLIISLEQLETIIDNYFFFHARRCKETMDLAFNNVDKFFESEYKEIADHLPQEDKDFIPGEVYDDKELYRYHLFVWIIAYNSLYGTNLTLEFVLSA